MTAEERAEAFIVELEALCQKHGFELSHEDSQGRFELTDRPDVDRRGCNGAFALVTYDAEGKYRSKYLW